MLAAVVRAEQELSAGVEAWRGRRPGRRSGRNGRRRSGLVPVRRSRRPPRLARWCCSVFGARHPGGWRALQQSSTRMLPAVQREACGPRHVRIVTCVRPGRRRPFASSGGGPRAPGAPVGVRRTRRLPCDTCHDRCEEDRDEQVRVRVHRPPPAGPRGPRGGPQASRACTSAPPTPAGSCTACGRSSTTRSTRPWAATATDIEVDPARATGRSRSATTAAACRSTSSRAPA